MKNQITRILDERQIREYEKTNALVDKLSAAVININSLEVMETLRSLSSGIKQGILEGKASNTDLYKLTDIADIMAFVHVITTEFDLYHNYN